jgi:hypothetical protein
MNKNLLLTLLVICVCSLTYAQTTILNFEAASVSTDFEYFGMGTLNGTTTSAVPNPDATGINTSSTVLEWTKEDIAYVWGGGFSNPVPTTAVDLTSDNQVCIKVWMDHIGNVGLKLENSATGDNWILTQPNTMMNQWEEICFNVTLPSIEAPATAAFGHVYPTIVLFIDFGTAGTGTNVISYIDDIITSASAGPTPADVTFQVDMNDYAGTVSNVYVNADFNSWCGTCDELLDPDSDGVYTGTFAAATGFIEYKYIVNAEEEEFSPFEECVITDPTGAFTNRNSLITGDVTLDESCFNSCYSCGDAVQIDIQLGFEPSITPSDSVYLAGGGVFSDPGGTYLMNDDDADGIYTISFSRERGWNSFYTFANGPCADYSCKEDIEGLPCAIVDNFNDRQMGPIMSDTMITTCFATCSDTATCGSGVVPPNGIFDPVNALSFQIAPSITSNFAVVVLDPTWQSATIRVFDMTGKEVLLANTISDSRFLIQVEGWSKGLYIVKVEVDGKTGTNRFVVD